MLAYFVEIIRITKLWIELWSEALIIIKLLTWRSNESYIFFFSVYIYLNYFIRLIKYFINFLWENMLYINIQFYPSKLKWSEILIINLYY